MHLFLLKLRAHSCRQQPNHRCTLPAAIIYYFKLSVDFFQSSPQCNPFSFFFLIIVNDLSYYSPPQNEPTARSTHLTMQGKFFPRGKSYGRLSRAKKFTNFQIDRRSTQRRVNLRKNVEMNAFEQLKREEKDSIQKKKMTLWMKNI